MILRKREGKEMQAKVIVKSLILNRSLKKALLIRRQDDDEEGGGTWESAGGKVEENESLEEAIIREIREETGITVSPERLLYASLGEINGEKHIFIVYLCTTNETKAVLSAEHINFRWVDKKECKSLLIGGIAEDYLKFGVYDMEW